MKKKIIMMLIITLIFPLNVLAASKYKLTYKLDGGKNNSSNPATYVVGKSVTLKSPTKKGYTFKGWYKDSKLTKKVTEISKKDKGNKTLYAKWSVNKYTIKFDANGGKGEMKSMTKLKYNKSYELTKNAYTKKGYKFTGWNTKKDGSGTSYENKATVKKIMSKDGSTKKLFAQWSPIKYTITFDANGGSGTMDSMTKLKYNKSYELTSNVYTRQGYKFNGWNTKKDGSGTSYENKATVKKVMSKDGSTKTLFAQWTPIKYAIEFDANGGTGSMAKMESLKYDKSYELTKNTYTRKGYVFVGWNTKRDGSGTSYQDENAISNLMSKEGSTKTLFAKWITEQEYKISEMNKLVQKLINDGASSRKELKDELLKYSYSEDDINYVIKNLYIDWNELALKNATFLVENLNITKLELKSELSYLEFTDSEKNYALNNININWKNYALETIKLLMTNNSLFPSSDLSLNYYLNYYELTEEEKSDILTQLDIDWGVQAKKNANYYLNLYPYLSRQHLYELLSQNANINIYLTDSIINGLNIDWNKQAMNFVNNMVVDKDSRPDVTNILSTEKFTQENIDYVIDNIDWDQKALEVYGNYINDTILSIPEISRILKNEKKFTDDEINYAVENYNNAEVNWNERALNYAKECLKNGFDFHDNGVTYTVLFSKRKLASFMEFSEEAENYVFDNLEVDWKENALQTGVNIGYYKGNDEQYILDNLEYFGFTEEEIDYVKPIFEEINWLNEVE